MNLEGQCVGLDSKGICDSSLANVQGVFVANNGLGKCDGKFIFFVSLEDAHISVYS